MLEPDSRARWQAYAGAEARLAETGETFAAVAKRRGGMAGPTEERGAPPAAAATTPNDSAKEAVS
jgi:hypothetical protein